jgi:hypothetical protein
MLFSSFYRLPLHCRHILGVALNADLFDLINAGPSVRAQNETDDLRNRVVEFFAVVRVSEFPAFSARGISASDTARSYPAPRRLFIPMAAGAFVLQEASTRPAIKTAVCDLP